MASNVITTLAVVVTLLAVVSAVLGFIAQATKLNPHEIRFHESTGMCVYPAKPAYALGICALPLLVSAMVISTVAAGCVKIQGGVASGSRRVKGVVCCVASWIPAAVAVADYVRGVRWNAATTRDAVAMGWLDGCYYLKGNTFAAAAVLTLVAAALGIRSFTMLLTPAAGAEPKQHRSEQPPVLVAAGVDGGSKGCHNQQPAAAASAPLPPQGQAPALV